MGLRGPCQGQRRPEGWRPTPRGQWKYGSEERMVRIFLAACRWRQGKAPGLELEPGVLAEP